jgi:hypothetical protein
VFADLKAFQTRCQSLTFIFFWRTQPMARTCIILFIALFFCIYLCGAVLAQEREPGWQMDTIRNMFNTTAIGRKIMHNYDIYFSDVCSWPLLSCDLNLHITSLQTSSLYFSFTIPPTIGQLTNLEVLLIQDGIIEANATIPESIGNLTNLRSLTLGSQLFGTIPNSFEHLKNLEVLELAGNLLTGTIPTGLATLPKLRKIEFGSNQLTGTIPDELVRGSCEHLSLSHNQLTGSVPHVIFESSLSILFISHNLLTTFAENTPRPPKLQYCQMENNPFVCPIPQWAMDECQATCTVIEPLPEQGPSSATIAIIISSASALALVIVLLTVFLTRRKPKPAQ